MQQQIQSKITNHIKKTAELNFGVEPILEEFDVCSAPGNTHNKEYASAIATKAMKVFESDTHMSTLETVDEELKPYMYKLLEDLKIELCVKNESEMRILEVAMVAHSKYIKVSKRMNILLGRDMSKLDVQLYSILSKEADKAFKQFNDGLLLLQRLQKPNINVNLKANSINISKNHLTQNNG